MNSHSLHKSNKNISFRWANMVFSSYIFLKKTDISATCRWETNSKAKCSPQHRDCRDRLPKLVASHPVHLDHSHLTFSSPVPFCCYLHNDDHDDDEQIWSGTLDRMEMMIYCYFYQGVTGDQVNHFVFRSNPGV